MPILIYSAYFYLPFYFVNRPVGVVSHHLVTSTQNATPEELNNEVTKVTEEVQSDESIIALIKKYGLFAKERGQGMPAHELIEKMRVSMVVGTDVPSNPPDAGVRLFVWAKLPDDGQEKTKALTDDIISRFESRSDFAVTTAPKPALPKLDIPLSTRIFFQLLLVFPALITSFLLIFIWEIPNLFYSKRTQEMVFDPIRSDWRGERIEAKTHGTIGDGIVVNVRYSFAFIGAMLAKSPIGEAFEFVWKIAR